MPAKRRRARSAGKSASFACKTGKVRYRNEFRAKLALASTHSRGRDEANYYRCKQCGGYHLTKNGKLPPAVEHKQLKTMLRRHKDANKAPEGTEGWEG